MEAIFYTDILDFCKFHIGRLSKFKFQNIRKNYYREVNYFKYILDIIELQKKFYLQNSKSKVYF